MTEEAAPIPKRKRLVEDNSDKTGDCRMLTYEKILSKKVILLHDGKKTGPITKFILAKQDDVAYNNVGHCVEMKMVNWSWWLDKKQFPTRFINEFLASLPHLREVLIPSTFALPMFEKKIDSIKIDIEKSTPTGKREKLPDTVDVLVKAIMSFRRTYLMLWNTVVHLNGGEKIDERLLPWDDKHNHVYQLFAPLIEEAAWRITSSIFKHEYTLLQDWHISAETDPIALLLQSNASVGCGTNVHSDSVPQQDDEGPLAAAAAVKNLLVDDLPECGTNVHSDSVPQQDDEGPLAAAAAVKNLLVDDLPEDRHKSQEDQATLRSGSPTMSVGTWNSVVEDWSSAKRIRIDQDLSAFDWEDHRALIDDNHHDNHGRVQNSLAGMQFVQMLWNNMPGR